MSGCQPKYSACKCLCHDNDIKMLLTSDWIKGEDIGRVILDLKKRIEKLENFMPDVLHDFEKSINEIEKRMNAQGDVNSENYFFRYDSKKRFEEIERQLYNKGVT